MKKIIEIKENGKFQEYEIFNLVIWKGQTLNAQYTANIQQSPFYEVEYELSDNEVIIGWNYNSEKNIIPIKGRKDWAIYNENGEFIKYINPFLRPFKLTIPKELCKTGGDYDAFVNSVIVEQTPYCTNPDNDNESIIYFTYLLESGGFSIDSGIVKYIDTRLKLECNGLNFENKDGIIRSI